MTRPAPLYGKKKASLATVAANIFCVLAVCLLLLLSVNAFLNRRFTPFVVVGGSMQQTLQGGDCLYTDSRRTASRGDVVIIDVTAYPNKYHPPNGETEYYIIKRLIAVEGDSLYCKDGVVYLKKSGEEQFSPLSEPYIYTYMSAWQKDFGGVAGGEPNEVKKDGHGQYGVLDFDKEGNIVPVTVGKGEIFFLGDHRDNSTDARDVGCLKATDIVSVVPQWAIEWKWYSTGLENFREKVLTIFGI